MSDLIKCNFEIVGLKRDLSCLEHSAIMGELQLVKSKIISQIDEEIHHHKLKVQQRNIVFDDRLFRLALKDFKEKPSSYHEEWGKIENWNVSNVTDMSNAFKNIGDHENFRAEVKKLDLTKWDVSNVTNMSYMFRNATTHNLYISNWNTSKVTDMSYMFYKCDSKYLKNVNLSGFDVHNVTNMEYMFCDEHRIRSCYFEHDLTNWDVSKVKNMSYMFKYREILIIGLSFENWNVSSVENMKSMFAHTTIVKVAIENGQPVMVNLHGSMRYTCCEMNLSGWANKLSNLKDASCMFVHTHINNKMSLDNWNLPKIQTIEAMFYYTSFEKHYESICKNLLSWNLPTSFCKRNLFDGRWHSKDRIVSMLSTKLNDYSFNFVDDEYDDYRRRGIDPPNY